MVTDSEDTRTVAFYTVTDSRHFLGVVGLINSLRLVGHNDPVFVTDAGLEPNQRAALETVVTVVDAAAGLSPELSKPVAPLRHPADVMILLDADVLVVRHLQPLVDKACAGKLVFFEDNLSGDRFFEEWSSLGLGPPRREPYVIAGHYLGHRSLILPLLEYVAGMQPSIDLSKTYFGTGDPERAYPYHFADQDLTNAYLMTTLNPQQLIRLGGELAPVPPFAGVTSDHGLACIGPDGVEPFLLHHIREKPWLSVTSRNLYVDLLRFVLWDPNAPIALDPRSVPLRLRPSRLARLDLARASIHASLITIIRGEMAMGPFMRRNACRLARAFVKRRR